MLSLGCHSSFQSRNPIDARHRCQAGLPRIQPKDSLVTRQPSRHEGTLQCHAPPAPKCHHCHQRCSIVHCIPIERKEDKESFLRWSPWARSSIQSATPPVYSAWSIPKCVVNFFEGKEGKERKGRKGSLKVSCLLLACLLLGARYHVYCWGVGPQSPGRLMGTYHCWGQGIMFIVGHGPSVAGQEEEKRG